MKKILFVLLLSLPSAVQAQTVTADRFRLNTGPCVLRSGSGSPEGAVVGSVCDMYVNTANGTWYTKWTGTNTNSGWRVGHNADALMSGSIGTANYVSQLTGWQITSAGAGDFRYLFTDELHAKSFIADLEQALAGGQIICKSVTSLGANFTNPAAAGTATLTVRDLPSAPNVSTFQANDWVGIRTFSRTAGSLTIGETFGVVTSYADAANGLQTWTFTRGTGANGGGLATSTVIETDTIVIDYGVSGNGCHEVNAIDGLNSVNSPYNQTWTWTTSPINANRIVRTRVGNLNGVLGVANEYGYVGGIITTGAAAHYIRASSVGLQIFGADLQMYDSTSGVNTVRLESSGPSFALGASLPTAYGTGTGVWMGKDSGTYKWRVGNPAGNRVQWDGSSLTVVGDGGGITNINGANIQTGTVSAAKLTVGSGTNLLRNVDCSVSTDDWTPFTTGGAPGGTFSLATSLASFRLNDISGTCYVTSSGTPAVSTQSQAGQTTYIPVVAGNKYEASAYLGVHRSGDSQVAINWFNAANTYLTTSFGNNCTTASAGGTQLSGYCRSFVIAAAPATATNAQFLVNTFHVGGGGGANPYLFWVHSFFGEALANQTEPSPWGPPGVTEIIGGVIKTGTITATQIAATSIDATRLNVSTLSAITANLGTITAGSITGVTITGGNVTLNSSGITITNGAAGASQIKWNDNSELHSVSGSLVIHAGGGVGVQLQAGGSSLTYGGHTGGAGYLCVDGSGVIYRNTTCP